MDIDTDGHVLITGASSGIGCEFARKFAREGYPLVLVARTESKLESLGHEMHETHGIKSLIISRDLSRNDAPDEIYREIERNGVRIDILVNNAGMEAYGFFHETDESREFTMIQVNLVALTRLTKLFLPGMVGRGYGRILNVGSVGSFTPSPYNAVYSATKAYVLSFTEAISEELRGTGVTVSALCPGAVRTELQAKADMDDIRFLDRGVLEADRVAEIGYRGLMRGKRVIIPGVMTKIQIFLLRFTPRSWVLKMAKWLLEQ